MSATDGSLPPASSTMAAAPVTNTATPPTTSPPAKCKDCEKQFGVFCWQYACEHCHSALCFRCANWSVVPEGSKELIQVCLPCLKTLSSLDFSTTYDVYGPEDGPAILMLHGGSGNRKQFMPQIRELCKQYRVYCIDLPGHGARYAEKLTMSSAIACVADFITTTIPQHRCVVMGVSLGGYIAMEAIGAHPDLFSGAVICCSGQTVGVGRGVPATLGLIMLRNAGDLMMSKQLSNMLVKQGGPNVREELIVELLRSGFFFNTSGDQCTVLEHTNPEASLPKFNGPILFANGSEDHHDGDQKCLQASKDGKLILYPGANHFITHDSRFMDTLMRDIKEFLVNKCHWGSVEQVAAAATTSEVLAAVQTPNTETSTSTSVVEPPAKEITPDESH